jgi:hypothetical protein
MFKTVLLATTALAVLAGSAVAQEALRRGTPASGELRTGDAKLESGEFYDSWSFQGRAGERVTLRMTSGAFDPYLILNGPNGFSQDNDDLSDGATDAGMTVALPTAGLYRVQATSYQAGESGRYSLSLTEGGASGPAPASNPIPPPTLVSNTAMLQVGRPGHGELRAGDDTLTTGEFGDPWRFHGRRGETYTITLESSDFDPYLVVRGPGGLSEDNDDDPSRRGSSSSRVTFTMPADGDVNLSATSYKPGETGRYTVSLTEGGQVYSQTRGADGNYAQNLNRQPTRPGGQSTPAVARPGAPANAAPIAVGESRDGRLGQGAATLSSGEFVNSFTLRGRQGQQLDLRMSSTEFDPYLQISGPNGFSAFNDDDADREGSHDSRLIVTLPADGAYTIGATSYQSGESGRLIAARAAAGDAGRGAPSDRRRPDAGRRHGRRRTGRGRRDAAKRRIRRHLPVPGHARAAGGGGADLLGLRRLYDPEDAVGPADRQ